MYRPDEREDGREGNGLHLRWEGRRPELGQWSVAFGAVCALAVTGGLLFPAHHLSLLLFAGPALLMAIAVDRRFSYWSSIHWNTRGGVLDRSERPPVRRAPSKER